MKIKLRHVIFVYLLLYANVLTAQQKKMSLDNMFNLADSCSINIAIDKLGVEAAQEGLLIAQSAIYPDISLSLSGNYLGNGYLWNRNFQNGQVIDIPHFGNNFALMATQVAYAGGAIKSGIALAELSTHMSMLTLQNNRQELRFVIAGNYMELYKLSNHLQVLDKNIALTELVLEKMNNQLTQGTILKNDIIRYELQLETLKLQKARLVDAKNIINHQLTTTLHLPADTEIVPDTNILHADIELLSNLDWQQKANRSNIGLQQAELAVNMSEEKEKLARSEILPKIVVVAADHLDGPITIEVPVLNNNFNYWYVGIGVQYQLSSLYKSNHKIQQSHLLTQQAREQYTLATEQIENAVYASYVGLKTSFSELKIQEKNCMLANQNYLLIENRYQNDLALITDMLDAGNTKLSAELELVNTKVNVVYNYLKLKYISGIL